MPFKAKVIFPPNVLLDPKAVIRVCENTLTGVAQNVKIDFDVTTQTWQDRPKFTIERSPLRRIVATRSDIYRFISRGTRVRYAVMTNPFAPKTRVGYIGSNKGVGGMAFIGIKPLPGIEARKFEETIGKKWQKEMPVILQRAIDAEYEP